MTTMTQSSPVSPKHGPDKAITLALTLAQAEKAIHAFTSGQIDAVLDTDGHAYLLRPAQERLRQDERLLQAVLDSASDVITVVNRGGVILSQSHAVSRVLGYERGKLLGTNIFDLVHEQDVSAVYFAFFEVIEGFCENTTVRFLHRAPDGSYRMIEAAVGKLRDSCSAGVVFSLRLISNPPPRRTDQAWPGAPDMPPDGEERECIMLSHGRRVPLSRDSGPAWAAVDPA